MPQRGGLEVAMAGFRAFVIRVAGHAHVIEGCHEGKAFGGANRPLGLWQGLDTLPGNGFLGGIIAALGNPCELEACAIQPGCGANSAFPARVVPGDPDGNMPQGRVLGAIGCAHGSSSIDWWPSRFLASGAKTSHPPVHSPLSASRSWRR